MILNNNISGLDNNEGNKNGGSNKFRICDLKNKG